MKKIIVIIGILILNSCNSSKKVEKTIAKGNYDRAIILSVKKLSKNKQNKKKQKFILLLEEAFTKATQADMHDLERHEKDSDPEIIASIYETYVSLDDRQELIKPILPLYINNSNRNAVFNFIDYSSKINKSKDSLSSYLYSQALSLLKANNIISARKAYEDLKYLKSLNANYKDVNSLMETAHFKGTNFVLVSLINNTNQVIPSRLESDLLNFNTYDLDDFWTEFHSRQESSIDYNYQLELLFTGIDVSPERLVEKQKILKREVKDGFEYMLDKNGHIKKDSLGNGIKVDKYITVRANYIEIHQEKACHIQAKAVLLNKNNRELERFPLENEFIFLHDFAEIDGDKRALDNSQLGLIEKRELPFPSNEQLIFDTGEELKENLKSIINDLDLEF